MSPVIHRLRELLLPVIESMGYELVGVEYEPRPGNALLRVYIDSENGIGLGDCQAVSHQVSGLLDVEEPISGEYSLEVSSPGLDRPLFDAEHYVRFSGEMARFHLDVPVDGKRKFTGLLKGVQGSDVVVEVDNEVHLVPLGRISKARIVPQY